MRSDAAKAIENAVADALAGVPIEYPNTRVAPASGAKWAKIFHLSIPTKEATIGTRGLDVVGGIVQVRLHYPLRTGSQAAKTDEDLLTEYFYAGRALTCNGQESIIQSCTPLGGKESDDWYVQNIAINWLAYTVRGG